MADAARRRPANGEEQGGEGCLSGLETGRVDPFVWSPPLLAGRASESKPLPKARFLSERSFLERKTSICRESTRYQTSFARRAMSLDTTWRTRRHFASEDPGEGTLRSERRPRATDRRNPSRSRPDADN